jgi:hypothetical protein
MAVLQLFHSPLNLISGATGKPPIPAAQRPVDFAFPKFGPVGILGRPLSVCSVAANPNVTNGRKGPYQAIKD